MDDPSLALRLSQAQAQDSTGIRGYVPSTFARSLERELAARDVEITRLRAWLSYMPRECECSCGPRPICRGCIRDAALRGDAAPK